MILKQMGGMKDIVRQSGSSSSSSSSRIFLALRRWVRDKDMDPYPPGLIVSASRWHLSRTKVSVDELMVLLWWWIFFLVGISPRIWVDFVCFFRHCGNAFQYTYSRCLFFNRTGLWIMRRFWAVTNTCSFRSLCFRRRMIVLLVGAMVSGDQFDKEGSID